MASIICELKMNKDERTKWGDVLGVLELLGEVSSDTKRLVWTKGCAPIITALDILAVDGDRTHDIDSAAGAVRCQVSMHDRAAYHADRDM